MKEPNIFSDNRVLMCVVACDGCTLGVALGVVVGSVCVDVNVQYCMLFFCCAKSVV